MRLAAGVYQPRYIKKFQPFTVVFLNRTAIKANDYLKEEAFFTDRHLFRVFLVWCEIHCKKSQRSQPGRNLLWISQFLFPTSKQLIQWGHRDKHIDMKLLYLYGCKASAWWRVERNRQKDELTVNWGQQMHQTNLSSLTWFGQSYKQLTFVNYYSYHWLQ